jgi:hypothetical protein
MAADEPSTDIPPTEKLNLKEHCFDDRTETLQRVLDCLKEQAAA